MNLKVGMKDFIELIVDENNIAKKYGEHLPEVFATPDMLAKMEAVSSEIILKNISEDQMSVGFNLNVDHIGASPIGMKIRVESEIIEISGKKIIFKVEAYDEIEKVGVGTHTRFILDKVKFNKGLEEKIK